MSDLTTELHYINDMGEKERERFKKIKERPVVMEVRDLQKVFVSPQGDEITALGNINISIHRREFINVIGPSGCGKSTLMRILAGLDYPTGGEVLLDGTPIKGPGPDRGMVFQAYTLFPWLTVVKNVMFGLKQQGHGGKKAWADAMQWLDMVGLADFANHYPSQLSGGMKQRVAIARALANKPRILFMDEPFGALDPQTRCEMQMNLLKIWQNVDVTIIFITHDLDEAVLLADRILVLGRNPGHVKEFIEVPLPRPRKVEQLFDPLFIGTKHRLEELIHPPGEKQDKPFHVIRMTEVGDDVF